jgi:hypothetical protein
MSSRVYGYFGGLVLVASHLLLPSYAATWVPIQGHVRLANGTPICALVLANGQYMFSCDGTGGYSLNVPPDGNGQITFFAFADGLSPYGVVLDASAFPFTVRMEKAPLNSPEISVRDDASCSTASGFVELSGDIQSSGGTSLCAMVLANGQHMFSCGAALGKYILTVPIDENQEVTLFSFADGFQPYKIIYDAAACSYDDGLTTLCYDHADCDACTQLCNQGDTYACQIRAAISHFNPAECGVPIDTCELTCDQTYYSCNSGCSDLWEPHDCYQRCQQNLNECRIDCAK